MAMKPAFQAKRDPQNVDDRETAAERDRQLLDIVGFDGISRGELDTYQVALVPPQEAQERALGGISQRSGVLRILIVPLTWKDLATRFPSTAQISGAAPKPEILQFGEIQVDLFSIQVTCSGRPVRLSAMEFKVLRFFVTNPNRMISREELLNEVWGYNNYPCTRTVDNHVLRLRQKLEPDGANPIYFRTMHGFGYRFTP